MPVSTISNRRTTSFDYSLLIVDGETVSASGSSDPLNIELVAQNYFKALVYTPGYTGYDDGVAEWSVVLEVSDSSGGTYVPVTPSFTLTGGNQEIEFALSGNMCDQFVPGASYIRATVTKTGTPGNLTYTAYLGM